MHYRLQLCFVLSRLLSCSYKQADALCIAGQILVDGQLTNNPYQLLENQQEINQNESVLRPGISVCDLAKVAICTTNADVENQCLINYKCVCGVVNDNFL